MRSHYTVRETERAHFVTSTIVDWLPLFTLPSCCDILVGSLDFCRQKKGLHLYAWVIMDNQFHAVVQCEELARVMADLKKFTAHRLLAQIEAERRLACRGIPSTDSGQALRKLPMNLPVAGGRHPAFAVGRSSTRQRRGVRQSCAAFASRTDFRPTGRRGSKGGLRSECLIPSESVSR